MECARALAGLRSGDGPLNVRVAPPASTVTVTASLSTSTAGTGLFAESATGVEQAFDRWLPRSPARCLFRAYLVTPYLVTTRRLPASLLGSDFSPSRGRDCEGQDVTVRAERDSLDGAAVPVEDATDAGAPDGL